MKRKNCIMAFAALLILSGALLFTACRQKEPGTVGVPGEIRVEDEVLCWDAVEHATGYGILIDDTEYESETNRFDLFFLITDAEVHSIRVRAHSGSDAYGHSAWSEVTEYRAVVSGDVIFVPIEGKDAYAVQKNPEKEPVGKLVIPDKNPQDKKPVTEIAAAGFQNCTGITGLLLPDSILAIRRDAFEGCTGLTRAFLADKTDIIESDAFRKCTALREVHLPEDLKIIRGAAFYDCTSLEEIRFPAGLKSLGAAFSGTALRTVTIPASVEEIVSNPFRSCPDLISVSVEEGNETFFSEGNCVIRKEDSVLQIGTQRSVIPASVKAIGSFAFYECTGLTEIVIPENVKIIGYNSFSGCTGLTEIVIPGTMDTVKEGAFSHCKNLRRVVLEEGIRALGGNGLPVFWSCESLTSLHIPASVEYIFPGIVNRSENLTSLTVDPGNRVYRSESNCIIQKEFSAFVAGCPASILPEGIRIISGCSFYGCIIRGELVIPEGVEYIVADAFEACQIDRLILPDSLKLLGSGAFYGATVNYLEFAKGTRYRSDTFERATILETVLRPRAGAGTK